jgi:YaiO family outer membrane protein
MNGDDLFLLARNTAFAGRYDEAKEMLQHILEEDPGYQEARLFLARVFYWDQEPQNAKQELETVLSEDATDVDALDLLADVERALREVESARLKNSIGIQYGVDIFSRAYNPAHYLSIQAMRTEKSGTGILRFNYTNRFSLHGLQGEIDLYPKINSKLYAYVNYGYSKSELFPQHRAGGEIYSKLFASFEGSLGARYLYFESVKSVVMYTGSINLYYRNYLFSFRPFLISAASGNGFASVIAMRRYLRDSDNYFGLSGGLGFSPDEGRLQSANGLSSDAVYELKAQRLRVNWQKTFNKNYILLLSIGVVRQELSFSLGDYVWISNMSLILRKRYSTAHTRASVGSKM